EVGMRLYSATRVIPPETVPGRMRVADGRDLDLLARWNLAFCRDCNLTAEAATAQDEAVVATRSGDRYIWEVGGEPVTMAGVSGRTPSGIRVNRVYTPNAQRGTGYASAIVATVTAAQLASGKRVCVLFTD